MSKFLSCTNMTGGYGGEDIIHACDIEVDKNQIVVIVGPNGAGKSTAMKAMLGMISLKEGSLMLDGSDISCLLYTSPSPRDPKTSRMPSSA